MNHQSPIKKQKWVIVPGTDIIQSGYTGYVINGRMMPGLREEDIRRKTTHYDFEFEAPGVLRIVRAIIMLPVLILSIPIMIVVHIRTKGRRTEEVRDKIFTAFHYVFPFYRRRIIEYHETIRDEKEIIINVDVPREFESIKEARCKLAIYHPSPECGTPSDYILELVNKGIVDEWISDSNGNLHEFIEHRAHLVNSVVVLHQTSMLENIKKLYPEDHIFNKQVVVWDPGMINYDQIIPNDQPKQTRFIEHFRYSHYIKTTEKPGRVRSLAYYMGYEGDESIRQYIVNNHSFLSKRFSEKGFEFIYIPLAIQEKRADYLNDLIKWVHFSAPALRYTDLQPITQVLSKEIEQIADLEIERRFFESFELPDLGHPVFLRYIGKSDTSDFDEFTYQELPLIPDHTLEVKLADYFHQLSQHIFRGMYSRVKTEKGFWRADDFFYEKMEGYDLELNDTDLDELKKIEEQARQLRLEEKPQLLHGLLEILARHTDEKTAKLIRELLIEKTARPHFSPLVITKDYNIILPDYGNMEITMYPLAKILFFLFLRYPDGLMFKSLVDHRDELCALYEKVTGRPVTKQVAASIEDLVDATCPSINQKAARVRAAFRCKMPEEIAAHYYITGENSSPKKIEAANGVINDESGFIISKKID